MDVPSEVVGLAVTVGLAGAGVIGGMLRWSILRNIEKLDESMTEMKRAVTDLTKSLAQVREEGVTAPECATCRKECGDRHTQYQQDILSWMRRQEDKADKLLLMMANVNNGMGGVR